MLAQVERGHSSASTVWVGAVANALNIDVSRLHAGEEAEQELDVIPILRRTLASGHLIDPELEPEPIENLRPLAVKVGTWRRNAKYRKIIEVLPVYVDRLLVSGLEAGEPAYAMLTDAYRAANTVAHKLGYTDLNLLATERMEWAAARSGDQLLLANTQYVKAATLARIGAAKPALRLLTKAMADIEPLVDEDATAAAVYSTLHMRAGMIAASMADSDSSRAHLTEAAMLADTIGDGVIHDTVVGPTNVRLFQIAAEVDLGDAGRAIEISRGTNIPSGMAAERQTYYWLDTARAHLLNGNPDAAIDALHESRAVSPEHFRTSKAVKNVIQTAASQQRRANDGLRALANYAGIED